MLDLATVLAAQQSPPLWLQLVPFAVIFAIFYFVAIAPMRRRQAELQKTIAALGKGDKLITNGGLYGEVVTVDDQTIILKVAEGVKVRIARSAVASLQNPES